MRSDPDGGYQQRRGTSLACNSISAKYSSARLVTVITSVSPWKRKVALEEEERHVKPGAELPDVKGHELVESCFPAESKPDGEALVVASV
jgi:hypothetical protein